MRTIVIKSLLFLLTLPLVVVAWRIGDWRLGLDLGLVGQTAPRFVFKIEFWLPLLLLFSLIGAVWGYCGSSRLRPVADRVATGVSGWGTREKRAGVLMVIAVTLLFTRLTHLLLLDDVPLTDEARGALFGGRLMAQGVWGVVNPIWSLMPNRFIHEIFVGGMGSLNWLGGQIGFAVGELLGITPLLFAAATALTVAAVGGIAAHLLGTTAALVAMGFFFLSPMGFSLSATSETPILSRCCVALGMFLLLPKERFVPRNAFLAGLALGAAVTIRPIETIAVTSPLVIFVIVGGLLKKSDRTAVLMLLLGMLPALVVSVVHAHIVTGSYWMPVRLFGVDMDWRDNGGWSAFGTRFIDAGAILATWFLGPVGVALIMAGAVANRTTRLLFIGVILNLLFVALDPGMASPVRCHEAIVPLTIIACFGLRRIQELASRTRVPSTALFAPLAISLVAGLAGVNALVAISLFRQHEIHAATDALLDAAGSPSVLFTIPIPHRVPDLSGLPGGSFTTAWRLPRPDLSDTVIAIPDREANVTAFARTLSERALLRFLPSGEILPLSGPLAPLQRNGRAVAGSCTNVVMIVVDTLRADHVGAYGYRRPTTPSIDQFAAEAIRFDNAMSVASWTTPSMAAMLSSRYPTEVSWQFLPVPMSRKVTTVAEVFKANDYATGAVVSHWFVSRELGFDQGFDHFDQENALGHRHVSSPSVTFKAIDYLKQSTDNCRFLLVHYFDPHFDFVPHASYDFTPAYNGPVIPGMPYETLSALAPKMTKTDLDYVRALYDSEIRYTDDYIGILLDWMKQSGLYDDAVVVLTADHGEGFSERGDDYIGHGRLLHTEVTHVPLLIKPPRLEKAVAVKRPVSLIDLAPTIAALARLRVPNPGDFRGTPWRLSSLGTLGEGPVIGDEGDGKGAVIDGDWRLMSACKLKGIIHHDCLFDLAADPDERKNVADVHPGKVAELQQLLEAWRSDNTRAYRTDTPTQVFDDAQKQQLEALGYIE